jgi:hypothetical protein
VFKHSFTPVRDEIHAKLRANTNGPLVRGCDLINCEMVCSGYQEGTASGLEPSLPLFGDSDYKDKNNHSVKLTLAQSLASGKLQLSTRFVKHVLFFGKEQTPRTG